MSVEAKQQCRLQRNSNQVPFRQTGAGAPTATSNPPTSTSKGSSTALPSPTPFNYGTDPIRGVNMYVSAVSSLYLRHSRVTEADGLS